MKSKIFASAITVFVVILLVLSGPVDAFTFSLHVNKQTPKQGEDVEFIVEIDIDSDELLPVKSIALELTGPKNSFCEFLPNGAILSGCDQMEIQKIQAKDYGYGYGYAVYENISYNFGYGYGYTKGKLKYKITLDTDNYPLGDYETKIILETSSNSFEKQGKTITIVEEPSTSKNKDKSGSGCTTKWICTDWSDCVDGTKVRECYKETSYCYAGEKPETIKACSNEFQNLSGTLNKNQDRPIKIDYKEERSPYSKITGAVTGLIGKAGIVGVVIFIGLVAGLSIFVYLVRKRR